MKYLLDSVILIDHLNGIRKATDYLRVNHSNCAISLITRAEVLSGADDAKQDIFVRLLNSFANLPLDRAVADLSAEIRRTRRLKLPDAIQAATARQHELRLVTRNTRDFPPDRFDFVDVPYSA